MNKFLQLSILAIIALLTACPAALAGTRIELWNEALVDAGYIRINEIATLSGDHAKRISRIYVGPAPASGKEIKLTREFIIRRLLGMGLSEKDIEFSGSKTVTVSLLSDHPEAQDPAAQEIPAPTAQPANAFQNTAPAAVITAHVPTNTATLRFPSADTSTGVIAQNRPTQKQPAAATPTVALNEETQKQRINHLVQEYIRKQLDNKTADVVCDIRKVDIKAENVADIELGGISRGRLPGVASVSLTLKNSAGKICGYGSADLRSEANIEVPVTSRPLRKGQTVRGADVVIRKMRYTTNLSTKTIDPNAFIGMIAVQNLRAGTPVSAADFEPGLDIKRGQAVTVTVKGPGFSIREMCTALTDGRKGEMIKVESLIGKTTYQVRVVGPGAADLPISGAEASQNQQKRQ